MNQSNKFGFDFGRGRDPAGLDPKRERVLTQLELVEENTQHVQGPFPPLTA